MEVAHRLVDGVWGAWLRASWNLDEPALRDVLLDTLAQVDPAPVREWRDPLAFLEPVADSVTSAMYWQPPDDQDVVLTDPRVVAALVPIAEAAAQSPATEWWTTPAEGTALRYTSLFDTTPSPPVLTGARQRLHAWRERTVEDNARDRPTDPRAQVSGYWWSSPALASLVTTTRALPGLGSVQLAWEEDSFGRSNAAIWSMTPVGAPRVFEIDGPEAWVRLVEHYPLEVTSARRHDWYRTTGRDSAWYIPDWSAVAGDWDAVHVTVAGYLATATRACSIIDGDAATMMAGFSPDQSWWLTDTLTTTPSPQLWHNSGGATGTDIAWRSL